MGYEIKKCLTDPDFARLTLFTQLRVESDIDSKQFRRRIRFRLQTIPTSILIPILMASLPNSDYD